MAEQEQAQPEPRERDPETINDRDDPRSILRHLHKLTPADINIISSLINDEFPGFCVAFRTIVNYLKNTDPNTYVERVAVEQVVSSVRSQIGAVTDEIIQANSALMVAQEAYSMKSAVANRIERLDGDALVKVRNYLKQVRENEERIAAARDEEEAKRAEKAQKITLQRAIQLVGKQDVSLVSVAMNCRVATRRRIGLVDWMDVNLIKTLRTAIATLPSKFSRLFFILTPEQEPEKPDHAKPDA